MALSIVLLVFMILAWHSRWDELCYHTWPSSKELIDLGDATSFAAIADTVPLNSFVSVSGVLSNKAATLRGLRAGSLRFGRFQVRHLLGSTLYIEYPEEKYHPIFNPFTRVNVKGRLTSFGPDSELSKVRDFFKDQYHRPLDDKAMLIVVDEEPNTQYIYAVLFLLSIAILVTSFYFSIRGFMHRNRGASKDA